MFVIARFLHSELLATVWGLAKRSNSGMGTSSRSLGQGCWSRTGGGGGAVLVLPVSNLLFVLLLYICRQSSHTNIRIDRQICDDIDRHFSNKIDRVNGYHRSISPSWEPAKTHSMQFDLHSIYNQLNRSVIPILSFHQHKLIDVNPKMPVLVHLLSQP